MPGIFPNSQAGGVVIRNEDGTCLNPAGVQNAYCPSAQFETTCPITALPSDCTARITSAQINAFQSELLCFAERLNPTGQWDCGSTCNLSALFEQWMNGDYDGALAPRVEEIICAFPVQQEPDEDVTLVGCDGDGNGLKVPITYVFGLLCGVDEVEPDEDTRLLACDGDGNPIKVNPTDLIPNVCEFPEEAPDADTRIVACDGDDNPILINPADLQNCFCPPPEGAGPPTTPPDPLAGDSAYYVDITDPTNRRYWYWDGTTWQIIGSPESCGCPPLENPGPPVTPPTDDGTPTDVPWRVDITDPGNRVLYYWNGTNWQRIGRPDHLLVGDFNTSPGITIDPFPNGVVTHRVDDFVIPNSSPFPITVTVDMSAHKNLQPNPTVGANVLELNFAVFDGPGATGTVIAQNHTQGGFVNANSTPRQGDAEWRSGPRQVVIPPGGRTMSVRTQSNGSNATTSLAIGVSAWVTWYGTYAEGMN